jgi:adenosine deaminase
LESPNAQAPTAVDHYLRAAPKAELHVHLEGAIRPATLLELARRNGVALPADDVDGLRRWFAFRDFRHFVEVYVTISRCLRSAADYELIAYEFGAEMARQHARYAEVTFSPSTHVFTLGNHWDATFAGLTRGRLRAQRDFGVQIHWIFDIVRTTLPDQIDFVTRVAVEARDEGVVALGLGGLEADNPPEPFARWFEQARAAGLHSVPHAGEIAGPESIWGAIRVLGAERIAHGVRAIEAPALVAYLAEHRIPLDVCPTSNVRLGVFPRLADHPLRRLYDAGVPLSVNSDDPPLFDTTLNDEVALLPAAFGLTLDQVDEILLNGIRHSFLPDDQKAAHITAFRAEMARLRPQVIA